jgi:hypothetical protein
MVLLPVVMAPAVKFGCTVLITLPEVTLQPDVVWVITTLYVLVAVLAGGVYERAVAPEILEPFNRH